MDRRTLLPCSRCQPAGGCHRGGFTLVELLVVIAIIAMLMALLVPAVQRAREAGRRTTCMNNQQQLGKAIMNYVTAKDRFPSGFSPHPASDAMIAYCMGWVPPMLPYIEQNPLHQQIQADFQLVTLGRKSAAGANINPLISTLVCPSRSAKPDAWAPLSYVVNAGMPDRYPVIAAVSALDVQTNGVFFDNFSPVDPSATNTGPRVTTDLAYLNRKDGASLTVLLSESIDAEDWLGSDHTLDPIQYTLSPAANQPNKGSTWWQGIVWFIPPSPPDDWNPKDILNRNTDADIPARTDLASAKPSSSHPGGFLMTMCDGHTEFISEDIEYRVYALVMAPDSDAAKDPRDGDTGETLYPGFNDPTDTTWWTAAPSRRLKPVTADDLAQ